jgi:NIMA (never in mitosis gene a)-related kinase
LPSLSDYRISKELGAGAFGVVVLAEKGGQRFCIKKVDVKRLPKKEKDAAIAEAKVLEKFRHPNIVRYEEFFIDQKVGALCIVMELAGEGESESVGCRTHEGAHTVLTPLHRSFAEDGDLHARLKKQKGRLFGEELILNWFVQICLAMKHVHDRKVLHRDIKTQNIFLTRGETLIKVGDFGEL